MTTLDWAALSEKAVDAAELKKRLDLVTVCEEMGVLLEEKSGGKFNGICPFHDDHVPTFDIYENDKGEQRAGCFACDFGNGHDMYSFIMRMKDCGFREAVLIAAAIATRTHAAGVRVRRTPERGAADMTFVSGAVERAATGEQSAIQTLLSDREIFVPMDWVISEFKLGTTPDLAGVVMPHYIKNTDGTLEPIAAKIRRATTVDRPWKPIASSGSQLTALYGQWRDQRRKHVVLVEGESDTWSAVYHLRGYNCEVFGLPAGAAQRPRKEWIEFLGDRDVTLLFDADDGGRVALRNWSSAIGVVRVAQLPEGFDVTSAARKNVSFVVDAVLHAETVGTGIAPGLHEAVFGGYERAGDENHTPVSNFTLRLARTIELVNEGSLFDVVLPNGRLCQLASSEMQSDARFRVWCNRHDVVWYGTTKDCQELLRMLLADAIFMPKMRGTRVAGWAEGTFVYPEPIGCIGGSGWSYVPPVADIDIGASLSLMPGPWEPHVLELLTRMHQPAVITPILGWIAAAPLRATMKAFPILAVVGGAGWGKTTLMREVLESFGYSINSTLTSTTPHAVASFAASTNAAPVWYDEYRKGAREDALQTFNQIVRDAWESSASYKGGIGEQKQALTAIAARAPLVVTGEDAFSETSHLERMAIIHLPRDGRDVNALVQLRAAVRTGLGRAYLQWLTDRFADGCMPAMPNIPDRPAHARAVVCWGYSLLNQFCRETCGYELMPFDESMLLGSHVGAAAVPVLIEALQVCINRNARHGGGPIAWRQEDGALVVKLHDLVKEARELGIILPGGPRATRTELEERYDVTDGESTWGAVLILREKP